jgi:hypothetical protein
MWPLGKWCCVAIGKWHWSESERRTLTMQMPTKYTQSGSSEGAPVGNGGKRSIHLHLQGYNLQPPVHQPLDWITKKWMLALLPMDASVRTSKVAGVPSNQSLISLLPIHAYLCIFLSPLLCCCCTDAVMRSPEAMMIQWHLVFICSIDSTESSFLA